jgi:hypothetical protein
VEEEKTEGTEGGKRSKGVKNERMRYRGSKGVNERKGGWDDEKGTNEWRRRIRGETRCKDEEGKAKRRRRTVTASM